MDVDELAGIQATLIAAIGEAKVVLQEVGSGDQFREIVHHAREMHDILLDAIAERLRGLSESFGNAIEELERA